MFGIPTLYNYNEFYNLFPFAWLRSGIFGSSYQECTIDKSAWYLYL